MSALFPFALLAGCGGANSTSSNTPASQPPVANAGGPYASTAGTAITLNGTASTDPQGQSLTYAWNFGDSSTGTGATPTHTYAATGTYSVSLTVTDTAGLTGTAASKATITAPPLADAAITGTVYSGQQPIAGAHVYLFAANATGYGQASVPLMAAAQTGASDSVGAYVLTGSNGSFSLTGDYTCASGQQLYLYTLGGTNVASGLLAAIGNCPARTAPAISLTVNEVSTIAAAYALSGFATDATHVSSSGTALAQIGVANAFANAANLVNLQTGTAVASTPAGNGTVPQSQINTLANILAACVNTQAVCSTLDSLATADGTITGTPPPQTATAAINIAHHPAANVAALYALASPVFTPALSAQPNDLTIGLTFLGADLDANAGIAIDGLGDAWVTSAEESYVTKLSSTGAPLSGSNGFTGGGLNHPNGIAIDASGNAWVTNTIADSVIELSNSGVVLSGASGYTGGGLHTPVGIAIDAPGNAWIANEAGSVTELSSSGLALSGANGYTAASLTLAFAIAIDASGNAWVTGLSSITELSSSGTVLSGTRGFTGGGLNGPDAIAIDASGDAWIANDTGSGATELSSSGSALSGPNGYTGGGLSKSGSMAIDGSGNAWFANNLNYSVSELSSTGSALSAANGYVGPGLATPGGIAIDGSGDVWVANNNIASGDSVTEFIGAAIPVVTPLSVGVKNNTLGTRP
jgi:PKD repeat protein